MGRFQSDVFGTVLRLTHDRDAALELTNSIFYKTYKNLDAYEAGRRYGPGSYVLPPTRR